MDHPLITPVPLTPDQQKIADAACAYVKEHKNEIVERFAGEHYPSTNTPISYFMAGSPGAGKTEFSKSLIDAIGAHAVRIDGDEIRAILPGYSGSNSFLFQRAISNGVNILHDHVLHKRKSFVLDATFSDFDRARKNINRSLKRGRPVIIVYVYQDPFIAWKFTKMRELSEGRSIPRHKFIELFSASKQTVQAIKDEFNERVEIWFVEKNLEMKTEKNRINIDRIDSHITTAYSKDELEKSLPL